MHIEGLRFHPPEFLLKKEEGIYETLSDVTDRRVVQGFRFENTFPDSKSFAEGIHVLPGVAGATHTILLRITENNAEILAQREQRIHRRQNRVLIDRKGILLPNRGVMIGKGAEGQYAAVGIARRYGNNELAVEWYLFL